MRAGGRAGGLVPLAVTYDEQPLTYRESVKQRRRWSSGTIQVARQYLPRTGRQMTAAPPGSALLDIGMTMLIPAYQLVAVVNTLAAAAAAGLSGRPFTFAAGAFCGAILLNVGLTAVFATLSGALVLTVERKVGPPPLEELAGLLALPAELAPPSPSGAFSSRLRSGRRSGTPAMCCRSRSWPGSGDTCGKRRTAHAHGRSSQFVGKALLQKSSGDRWAAPNRSQTQWIRFGTEEQGSGRMSAR